MKLNIREKKVLYAFACPNYHNTVTRLKWLTALTVDPQAKCRMLKLARKIKAEDTASIYTFNTDLKRRLTEFSRKYPQLCRLEHGTAEG